ncbi:hypothetical protein, partial [Lentilactobacillus hilgardii]
DKYTDSADLAFWFNYGRMDNLLTDQQKTKMVAIGCTNGMAICPETLILPARLPKMAVWQAWLALMLIRAKLQSSLGVPTV